MLIAPLVPALAVGQTVPDPPRARSKSGLGRIVTSTEDPKKQRSLVSSRIGVKRPVASTRDDDVSSKCRHTHAGRQPSRGGLARRRKSKRDVYEEDEEEDDNDGEEQQEEEEEEEEEEEDIVQKGGHGSDDDDGCKDLAQRPTAPTVMQQMNPRPKRTARGGLLNQVAQGANTSRLDLRASKIDDSVCRHLASTMAAWPSVGATVHTLDLEGNTIGDDGAAVLATAFKTTHSLRHVDLGNNLIEHDGCVALANWIKRSTTIQELSLAHNSIGDAGVTCVARALHTNRSLTSLDLRCTDISDEGIIQLASALATNEILRSLSIQENDIGDAGLQALVNCFQVRQDNCVCRGEYGGHLY
jgi:hypothetical protein